MGPGVALYVVKLIDDRGTTEISQFHMAGPIWVFMLVF